jgi:hypothetical protein
MHSCLNLFATAAACVLCNLEDEKLGRIRDVVRVTWRLPLEALSCFGPVLARTGALRKEHRQS